MGLRLDDQRMKETLNVLLLSHPGDDMDLARIHEVNSACVKVNSPEGPGEIGRDIAVLSWRWDTPKLPHYTLDDMRDTVSPKVIKFIHKARVLGFRWAWCDYMTVPQFSDDKEELMVHIQSSRTLYQRCSVIVVDVEEVYPGLAVPSMDFQTRLWIAAEKSAVLVNPNVTMADYVQVSRLNLGTILMAVNGPWGQTNLIPEDYHAAVTALASGDAVVASPYVKRYVSVEQLLMLLWSAPGFTVMQRKYPGLPMWLNPNDVFGGEPPEDQRYLTELPPMSDEEQEALILDYWGGKAPGAETCTAERPTPQGAAHPAVAAILEAMEATEKRPRSFSYYDHFPGLLLLASEVFDSLRVDNKFEPQVFDNLMTNLGLNKSKPAPPPDAPHALKAFMRSDFEIVRDMILADSGEVELPAAFAGVDLPTVPHHHEVKQTVPVQGRDAEELLLAGLVLRAIDWANAPAATPVRVALMLTSTMGNDMTNFSVDGRDAQVTLSGFGTVTNVTVWGNPPAEMRAGTDRQLQAFELATDQCWLQLSLTVVRMDDPQHPTMVNVMGAARGVTSTTVRQLYKGLSSLMKEGGLEETDAAKERVRAVAAAAGVAVDETMYSAAQ